MPMKTVDYIYRYDPRQSGRQPILPDERAAREELEKGNRIFSEWVESCRVGAVSQGEPRYVLNCNYLGDVMGWNSDGPPRQTPFAIVVGCSDARVPVEMVLGQGPNVLFVVRVAGNLVDAAGQGSIDYALEYLGEGLRTIVVLGHACCGAVTGAVDSYLHPDGYWSFDSTPPLRSILRKIFVAVRASANALDKVFGEEVRRAPGYRAALVRVSVYLNAAQSAYDIKHATEQIGKSIPVLFGVYNLHNGYVGMPAAPDGLPSRETQGLVPSPSRPQEFVELADRVARCIDPGILGSLHLMPGQLRT